MSFTDFKPCLLRDWELHVHFKVHGKGSDLFGDGFAIWYTKDRSELGEMYNMLIYELKPTI